MEILSLKHNQPLLQPLRHRTETTTDAEGKIAEIKGIKDTIEFLQDLLDDETRGSERFIGPLTRVYAELLPKTCCKTNVSEEQ
ncbi:hypothetical protein PT974_03832 [Cladobotryum mycophilum]|uniref:Uncharacterized protein n=1 Tax=Cladobotryum mycophilum TaxID=491253 RepID=A0ABR0STE7_9HYPO